MVPRIDHSSFGRSIVRIRNKNGLVIGAGFLVKEKILLTCAHVIRKAVGSINVPINTQVSVDFPLIEDKVILKAQVIFFDENDRHDIAGLKLIDELPTGAQNVNLMFQGKLFGHHCSAFGFPSRHDQGVWAEDYVIHRPIGFGWLQIDATNETGYRIDSGFSGTPLWDNDLEAVVGITVAKESAKNIKAAFVIPIDAIINYWPELKELLGLDDPQKKLKIEINSMSTDNDYAPFMPLINAIKHAIEVKAYDYEVLNSNIKIIKNLQDSKKFGENFLETFEKVSMGFIPSEWVIESDISKDNYAKLVKHIISLIKENRGRLTETLGLKIPIPIILAVMNREDASQLDSGIVFDEKTNELKEDFARFKLLLQEKGLTKWKDSYTESPESWIPFAGNGKTIKKLIDDVLFPLTEGKTYAVLIDIRDINKECYRQTLNRLREDGCIIVMDIISMQHPLIQREFRRSLLDAFQYNLMAKIAPNLELLDFVRQMSIIFELHNDLEFYKRRNIDKDIKKCQQISHMSDLEHWFKEYEELPMFKKKANKFFTGT